MLEGSQKRTPRPALVVDSDRPFLYSLMNDPKAEKLPPVLAETGPEAQLLLGDLKRLFGGIFVNLDIPNSYGISVIRFSHQNRPGTPIFVIYDGKEPPLSEKDFKALGIQQVFKKPLTYEVIMSKIAAPVHLFDANQVLHKEKENEEAVGSQTLAQDSEFVAVGAENFLAGSKSYFNVYVRLGSGKYIKILHAGDDLTADRVGQYVSKGVTHFYLRKDAQEKYVAYCDQLASTLVKNKAVPEKLRVSLTVSHGEETMNFLKTQGISESNLVHVADFVQNANTLVKQLNPETYPKLQSFLDDLVAREHATAVTMIASLMLPALSFESEKTVQIVGVSALLHDIGLFGLAKHLQDEDETKMSESERTIYEAHPDKGAEIVRGIRGIEPSVIQAIAQHHERRRKKGFPARKGGTSINRVAEIVGISDEFIRAIARSKREPDFNPFREMDQNIFAGFSFPVVDVFRRVFFRELFLNG